ncbi:unnamed protein product [Dracunculus medinensis]|uniref:FlgM domain-containing protein n=1 Tax=Dracunculus medinensis TaxID=318479 RepID=A0A0N4UJ97_DRAME|nr:unnamed protein product [Dracunculus medinensis]
MSIRMSQPQQIAQQFHSLSNSSEHCLNAIRLLRNEVVKANRKISGNSLGELDASNLKRKSLENHAKNLPSSTPLTVQLERLNRLISDGHIDPYINELYDRLQDASSWMETDSVS